MKSQSLRKMSLHLIGREWLEFSSPSTTVVKQNESDHQLFWKLTRKAPNMLLRPDLSRYRAFGLS